MLSYSRMMTPFNARIGWLALIASLLCQQVSALTPITNSKRGSYDPSKGRYSATDVNSIYFARNMWEDGKALAIATYGHISDWDVSLITNMRGLFASYPAFNEDISKWDVSNVTDMDRMFLKARSFNSASPSPGGPWAKLQA